MIFVVSQVGGRVVSKKLKKKEEGIKVWGQKLLTPDFNSGIHKKLIDKKKEELTNLMESSFSSLPVAPNSDVDPDMGQDYLKAIVDYKPMVSNIECNVVITRSGGDLNAELINNDPTPARMLKINEGDLSSQDLKILNRQLREIAILAWDAYKESTGGVSAITGAKLPEFDECPDGVKTAWYNVAKSMITHFLINK